MRSTAASVRQWVGESELAAELAADVARVWNERVESPDWLAGYAARCPVDATSPADYALREVPVLRDCSVLAGIHFQGLAVDRPFVGVYMQTRDLIDEEIAEASVRLCDELAMFSPRRVRWWSPDHRDLRRLPGVKGDNRLLVGRITDLTAAGSSSIAEGLCFGPEPAPACYDEYCRAHTDFTAQSPAWRHRMPLEDRQSLDECARAGALYCLRDAGRFAGLMAARPDAIRGIRGWLIVEEILGAAYRGRRLAAAMQRTFVSKLDSSRGTLVMGEIDDENVPSLRTAKRAGRKDVGGWLFVER